MHYVFTWMQLQNNKGAFTWHDFGYMWNKIWIYPWVDLANWGPQANIGMGPYTFAHIYLDQPWGFFFVVMLAAAQWCPIVESNVSTFFMYMF